MDVLVKLERANDLPLDATERDIRAALGRRDLPPLLEPEGFLIR